MRSQRESNSWFRIRKGLAGMEETSIGWLVNKYNTKVTQVVVSM